MPSLTRSTLVTRIGDLTGDPNNTRFSASKKQDAIQRAQERFVLDTRVLVDVSTDSIVAGTTEYSLPSDVLDVSRVTANSRLIQRTSELDLDIDSGLQDWTDDEGRPYRYYVDLDPNNKKLRLFPEPQSDDAGSNNLRIEYVKIPPSLSSDSSVPLDSHTLLVPYHDALAYLAAADLLKIQPSQQSVVMVNSYEKEYRDLVSHCIETFKNLADQKPMRFRGGRYYRGT